MSTVQDIIALSQAGFTKNEIVELLGGFGNERVQEFDGPMRIPELAPAPASGLAPAPASGLEPAPKLEPMTGGAKDSTPELMEKMNQMLTYVHSLAIRQSEQPPQPSADDVVAKILGAPRKE